MPLCWVVHKFVESSNLMGQSQGSQSRDVEPPFDPINHGAHVYKVHANRILSNPSKFAQLCEEGHWQSMVVDRPRKMAQSARCLQACKMSTKDCVTPRQPVKQRRKRCIVLLAKPRTP